MKKLKVFILLTLFFGIVHNLMSQNQPLPYIEQKEYLFTLPESESSIAIFKYPQNSDFIMVTSNSAKEKFKHWNKSGEFDTHNSLVTRTSFSPDGQRMAYIAYRLGKGAYVVVDGREYGLYGFIFHDTVVFSADGEHWTFAASKSGKPGKKDVYVITDGKKSRKYHSVVGPPPSFSPQENTHVYFAGRKSDRFIVIDNIEGPKYDSTGFGPYFFSKTEDIVYVGIRDESHFIHNGDTILGPFKEIWDVKIEPNGEAIWYSARADSSLQVYRNTVPISRDAKACCPKFSKDGKHMAYWVSDGQGTEWYVIDSVDDVHYTNMELGEFSFSPDGSHYYYFIATDSTLKELLIVFDGRVIDTILGTFKSLEFYLSPDNERFAYHWDVDSAEHRILIDSSEYVYGNIFGVKFSTNSQHFGFIGESAGGESSVIVLDGQEVTDPKNYIWDFDFVPKANYLAMFVYGNDKTNLRIGSQDFTKFDLVFPRIIEFQDDGALTYFAKDGNDIFRISVTPTNEFE